MFTPNQFYNVNPDYSSGPISKDDDAQVRQRPVNAPRSDRNFEKILDRSQDSDNSSGEDDNQLAIKKGVQKDAIEGAMQTLFNPQLNPTAGSTGEEAAFSQALNTSGVLQGLALDEAQSALLAKEMQQAGLLGAQQADSGLSQLKGENPATPDQLFSAMLMRQKLMAGEKDIAGVSEVKGRLDSSKDSGMGVNLAALPGFQQDTLLAAQKVQQAAPISRTYELMQQIVDQIAVYANATQTDTTITLKNIPQFEGVNVTVTSYSTAKGEINITFENLTQAGKHILDLADNRNALMDALKDKGLLVHMITTTTIDRNDVESSAGTRGEGREGREGGKGQWAGGGDRWKGDEKQNA